NVVARAAPFQFTTDAATKFAPLTLTMLSPLPATTPCGVSARSVGAGLFAAVPLPLSAAVRGLPRAASYTVSVPVRAPAALGAKASRRLQLPPAATTAPLLQAGALPACHTKSPVTLIAPSVTLLPLGLE